MGIDPGRTMHWGHPECNRRSGKDQRQGGEKSFEEPLKGRAIGRQVFELNSMVQSDSRSGKDRRVSQQ